jgi:cytochrome P450
MPFGAGPRTCLGALFAAQALRLMLPMVLRHARYSMVPGTRVSRLTRGNSLFPRYGLPMQLDPPHRRRGSATRITGDIGELVDLPG